MELTPEQMRTRIAELEGQLDDAHKSLDSLRGAGGPLTDEELHDMLHGPRAPEGAVEKILDGMRAELGIQP